MMQQNNKYFQACKLLLFSKKLAICLGVLVCVCTSALSQKITFSGVNVPLKKIFSEVKKQTGYNVFGNKSVLAKASPVSVSVKDMPLRNFMETILSHQPLGYKIEGMNIVISQKPADKETKPGAATQPNADKSLLGKLVDAGTEEPIIAASIIIKQTGAGFATDDQGIFLLTDVPNDAKLIISCIGYSKIEVPVSTIRTIHPGASIDLETYVIHREISGPVVFQMIHDSKPLDNTVVIGYGSKSSKDITSAISTVKGEDLERKAGAGYNSFDNKLGGLVPGVVVTQNSGTLGDGATISIRGITSPLAATSSANEPLYVINGVPMFNSKGSMEQVSIINPLAAIAANDIESIEILKDAAATAIYGSRGANGVIIVKTYSGKRNQKPTITVGYNLSIANPIKEYDPLNVTEFKNLQDEIGRNIGRRGYPFAKYVFDPVTKTYKYEGLNPAAFGTANTNWQKETRNRNAQSHQYDVAVRGGNESTNYSFSFNGTNQQGLFIIDRLSRYGTMLTINTDITKRLKTGAAFNYTYAHRLQGGNGQSMREWEARPDITSTTNGVPNWIDGRYVFFAGAKIPNPVTVLQLAKGKTQMYQFSGSAFLEYEVIKNLKLRSDVNIGIFQNEFNSFVPKIASADYSAAGWGEALSTLVITNSRIINSSLNVRADYQWTIGGSDFTAMAGYGRDRNSESIAGSTYTGFPDDEILIDAQNAANMDRKNSSLVDGGLNSVYSRIGYNYADKYLAELNFRTDASSKFGPGNKRGYFPAISVGWRISNENFMEATGPWLDDLKLRLSYGQTGSTNLEDFAYLQSFAHGNYSYYGGKSTVSLLNRLPNRNLRWEITTEFNAGLDFAFFKNRLRGNVNAYRRFTKGALGPAPPPLESGFTNYSANLIDVSNRGLEVEISGDIVNNKDWVWSASLNVAFNRNRIEKLNGTTLSPLQLLSYIEGQPSGVLKGFVVEKIFQTQAEIDALQQKAISLGHTRGYRAGFSYAPGDYMIKDLNGDGHITDADRTIIASPEPKYFGGFYNAVRYKNISLATMFQFSQGATAVWQTLQHENAATPMNSVIRQLYGNTWTPQNPHARYARMMPGDPSGNISDESDRYVFSTSYLRLKNVVVSYDIPASAKHLSGSQIYVGVSNMWTLSKWPGIDPEIVLGGDVDAVGGNIRNADPYPLSKSFFIGFKMKL